MRTVRCSGRRGGGGGLPGDVSVQWGVCPEVSAWGGMSAPGSVCLGGVYPSMHWDRPLPPTCEQNHRYLWKHNLSATTVAGGNKVQ